MLTETTHDRETRLRLMEKALVDGIDPDDLQAAAPPQFGVTPRQARLDLRRVLARLAALGEQVRRHEQDNIALALSVKRRQRIVREAIRNEDRRMTLEAEKDLCKLLGIYPQERTDLADAMGGQELDAAIESELATLAARTQTADAPASARNGRAENGRLAAG